MSEEKREFQSLKAFYPFYLSEHSDPVCRLLHFIGSSCALVLFGAALITGNSWLVLVAFVQGYTWAWVGHFVFEKNRPATFQHPLYSFACDWLMMRDMLLGRIPWR